MADETIGGFSPQDIDRIRKVVRRVEATPYGVGNFGGTPAPVSYGNCFWAKITGKEDPGYKYSWEKLRWSDLDNVLKPYQLIQYQQGRSTGSTKAAWNDSANHFAVEALTLSSWIPIGSYVRMYKVEYQPYFVFDFGPRTCAFKVGTTEITAYDEPNRGYRDDCKLLKDSGHQLVEDTASNKPIRLYNRSTEEIPEDTIVWATFTYPSGQWHIISRVCD